MLSSLATVQQAQPGRLGEKAEGIGVALGAEIQ